MCHHRPLSTCALDKGSLPCPSLCLHGAQRTVTCSFQVVPHARQCTEEGITVLLVAGGACTRRCCTTPSQKSYGCRTGSRHRSSGTKSVVPARIAVPIPFMPPLQVWSPGLTVLATTKQFVPWVEGLACCAGPHPLYMDFLRGEPRPPKGLTSLPLLYIHCRPHTFFLEQPPCTGPLHRKGAAEDIGQWERQPMQPGHQ